MNFRLSERVLAAVDEVPAGFNRAVKIAIAEYVRNEIVPTAEGDGLTVDWLLSHVRNLDPEGADVKIADSTTKPPWIITTTPNIPPPPLPYEPLIVLDPEDPFDAALIPIVKTNRKKRKDYAKDGDPFSNFKTSSHLIGLLGFSPADAALFNVVQKLARLQSLRLNGRMKDTANESVFDTYLDLAVYAIITYAIVLQELAPDDAT